MLAVFGATLAWIPLMQPGSYVIELHPGPPESLTCPGKAAYLLQSILGLHVLLSYPSTFK